MKKGGQEALQAYCINLNEKAAKGKIDPLIAEIWRLSGRSRSSAAGRRTIRSNVGDPGVGKTAIAEGLAKRIVDGDVPPVLEDATIFALDMGRCWRAPAIAATSRSGVKAVLAELENLEGSVLFIDEIHTVESGPAPRPAVRWMPPTC